MSDQLFTDLNQNESDAIKGGGGNLFLGASLTNAPKVINDAFNVKEDNSIQRSGNIFASGNNITKAISDSLPFQIF